jgi:citronellol/citronellal dehydrogenase
MGMLDGKIAIVTGASRGIGAEIASRFGAEGAAVVVAARTTEAGQSPLEGTIGETAESIRAAGGTAIAVAADLSKPADRERLVAVATEQLGAPDILVNTAAVTYFTRVEDFSPRRYQLMFDVQVQAPFHLSTLVLPGMRERGHGWILNISSRAALHPAIPPTAWAGRGGTVYGMCKAALERFSTGLAAELYPDSIAVNALSPDKVVPTPGTIFHHLTTADSENAEPPAVMAEAALMLCHADPQTRTGLITYSRQLLEELGVPVPGMAAGPG